jgi:hypothetical protein
MDLQNTKDLELLPAGSCFERKFYFAIPTCYGMSSLCRYNPPCDFETKKTEVPSKFSPLQVWSRATEEQACDLDVEDRISQFGSPVGLLYTPSQLNCNG